MRAISPTISKTGIVGQGFPIEVYNTLGAGDAFMSGFLRGWLQGGGRLKPVRPGPMRVARLPCRGCCARPKSRPLKSCNIFWRMAAPKKRCARTRRSTTSIGQRPGGAIIPQLMALAIDHRIQLEELADGWARRPSGSAHFKTLAVKATAKDCRWISRVRHADR